MPQIETPRRFSQSMLWSLTTDFYERQGSTAWMSGTVPSRISCNAFIADAYAQVIAGYLRDLAVGGSDASGAVRPVTVLELGAGAGQFGFLLCRALRQAVAADGRPDGGVAWRYLMTDVARSNVTGWLANPRLRELVDDGTLDVAVLDVGDPASARSAVSDRALAEIVDGGPVVMIANYLFDSLVHDAFRVEGGRVLEVKVGLDLDGEAVEVCGSSEVFEKLRFRQEPAPIAWPYYPEPAFDAILKGYAADLNAATFLFPVAALRCIDRVRDLAGGRLLLLASDKGHSHATQLEGRSSLGVALTGTFSSMVNFDALARWFALAGGTCKRSHPPKERFDTYALVLGGIGDDGETEAAFDRSVRGFGPAAYWGLASAVMDAVPRYRPRAMLALLALSRYDPYLIVRLEESLMEAIGACDACEREQFRFALDQALGNVYPDRRDLALTIGRLYQRLGQPEHALGCYAASLREHGQSASLIYKMSLCHAELGQPEEAVSRFREALHLHGRELHAAAPA